MQDAGNLLAVSLCWEGTTLARCSYVPLLIRKLIMDVDDEYCTSRGFTQIDCLPLHLLDILRYCLQGLQGLETIQQRADYWLVRLIERSEIFTKKDSSFSLGGDLV